MNTYRKDCFYFSEVIDFGGHIPFCCSTAKLEDCPCRDCKYYISKSEAYQVVRKYQDGEIVAVKRGEWVVKKRFSKSPFTNESGLADENICPFCKRRDHNGDGSFCGYCGAKMDGGAGRELKALRRMEGKRMNVKTFKLEDGRKYLVPARCCFNCRHLGPVLYDDGGPHTIMCNLSEDEKYADYAADMGLKCDAFEEEEGE